MNTEALFYLFTLPGIYIAIMLATYKIYRMTAFKGDEEGDARTAAFFWFITIPLLLILGGGYWIFSNLFDMIDNKEDK